MIDTLKIPQFKDDEEHRKMFALMREMKQAGMTIDTVRKMSENLALEDVQKGKLKPEEVADNVNYYVTMYRVV